MKPLIIAHRGASAYAPENTIAAFQLAVDMNADAIELDIRCTKDGQFIAFHDPVVQNRPLKEQTLAEIQAFCREHHQFEVPTLTDILEWVPDSVRLFVELKETGYETDILSQILDRLSPDRLVIISFQATSLQVIHHVHPGIKTAYLQVHPNGNPFHAAKKMGATGLDLHWSLLHRDLLDQAKTYQMPLYIWTVNSESMLRELAQLPQITGITTDVPDVAVRIRAQH